jgi:xanthine dehydrogenase accessory factor
MMPEWREAVRTLEQAGTPAVLVTVLATRGSAPRDAGAKMVVTADAQFGTIGGGAIEYHSLRIARELLADATAGSPCVREFDLRAMPGQSCGGASSILFEPLRPPAWRIALFGAGHVGQALVGVLGTLPCRVLWFDARPDVFPPACPPNVALRRVDDPAAEAGRLPAGTMVVVMTHEHRLDFEVAAAALARADLPFVGLIGSKAKAAQFRQRLEQQGMTPEAIARLTCPFGLPGVGGKLPEEIAVATAAQLLQVRDRHRLPSAPGGG